MSQPPAKAWRCAVCGYIHRGDEPPELCPVCGAPSSDFEAFQEKPSPAPASIAKRWRCLVCGYEHEGMSPPDECPVCGASRDSFEAIFEAETLSAAAGKAERIVVVGGGIAGVSAAEAIRRTSAHAEITLLSKEVELPYYRLNLTRLLAGGIAEDELPMHTAGWYADQRIRLLTGSEAVRLSLDPREVELGGGEKIAFDKLVLTTGAHAFVPPLPGSTRKGVFSLRTVEDAKTLLGAVRDGVRCVCIGGGILGLETAGALARRGADVTLLEGHAYLMPRQLSAPAAAVMKDFIAGLGIRLRTNARTKEMVGADHVTGVKLEDDSVVPADVVVITTGIRPNSHLARAAGLSVNTGVIVDNWLRSSHPDVFAAGDVCEHGGILYGSWHASQFQGGIAGMNAAGLSVEFGGLPRSHTLKVLGLGLMSIGKFEPEDGSYTVIEEASGGQYQRFVFRDERLVGAILMGDTGLATAVTKAVESRTDFSKLLTGAVSAFDVAECLRADRSK